MAASAPALEALPTITAVRMRPADLQSLDQEIYEGLDSYTRDDLARCRLDWIRQAVEHHLAGSPIFQRLCAAQGFSVHDLRTIEDLARVPLLSSGMFKKRAVTSAAVGAVKECTSSGTQGSKSIVRRDRRTLERFAGSVVHGMTHFFGKAERRQAFVLGPSTEEAGDLWFSYSLSLANMLYDTDFFVREGKLQLAALLDALRDLDPEIETPLIVAPPSLLLDLCDWLDASHTRVELANAYAITAGGWKRRANEVVDREELAARVARCLAIPAERQRDFFNMVELNTVIFECEHHRKHVPPWLEVIVRRPTDLAAARPGEQGILTYLDPTATSFPCFILSDDFGAISHAPCPCGRRGTTMQLDRRMTGIEERGCGLKMDRYSDATGGKRP